jgi:hypothetical protein
LKSDIPGNILFGTTPIWRAKKLRVSEEGARTGGYYGGLSSIMSLSDEWEYTPQCVDDPDDTGSIEIGHRIMVFLEDKYVRRVPPANPIWSTTGGMLEYDRPDPDVVRKKLCEQIALMVRIRRYCQRKDCAICRDRQWRGE